MDGWWIWYEGCGKWMRVHKCSNCRSWELDLESNQFWRERWDNVDIWDDFDWYDGEY